MNRRSLLVVAAFALAATSLPGAAGCARHDVTIEGHGSGRALSSLETSELQRVADAAFADARAALEGLPPRLTLIVGFGKDVNPETGETGAAGFPGNVGLTLDPDRDVIATIRTFVRPCLLHELHHLARRSRAPSPRGLRDRVIFEGLATAFERDIAKTTPPWGEPPPNGDAWVDELLRQPEDADAEPWMRTRPDGRRWVGYRVGTLLVDRASRASGQSAARLVLAPTNEVLRLALGGEGQSP